MELGKLHVVLVHFPIALALSAALADLLWAATRREFFRHAGFYCLILAAISVIPVAITGDQLLDSMSLPPALAPLGETHQVLGIASLVLILLATAVRALRRNQPTGYWLIAYAVLIVAVATCISLTGHYGGMLAFGKDYLSGLF